MTLRQLAHTGRHRFYTSIDNLARPHEGSYQLVATCACGKTKRRDVEIVK